jgi:hypothetical protein
MVVFGATSTGIALPAIRRLTNCKPPVSVNLLSIISTCALVPNAVAEISPPNSCWNTLTLASLSMTATFA